MIGSPGPTPVLILERPIPIGGQQARADRAGVPFVPIVLAGVLLAGGALTIRRRARLTAPTQGSNLLANREAPRMPRDVGDTQEIRPG